jgi:hypothetical protein
MKILPDRFSVVELDNLSTAMAVPKGLEPPTHRLGNDCSILLSYGTAPVLLS